jgi:hypothetical protein
MRRDHRPGHAIFARDVRWLVRAAPRAAWPCGCSGGGGRLGSSLRYVRAALARAAMDRGVVVLGADGRLSGALHPSQVRRTMPVTLGGALASRTPPATELVEPSAVGCTCHDGPPVVSADCTARRLPPLASSFFACRCGPSPQWWRMPPWRGLRDAEPRDRFEPNCRVARNAASLDQGRCISAR